MKEKIKGQQLLLLSVFFLVLFNFPFISIFNRNWRLAGIPVLFLYVFGLWLVFILTTVAFIERGIFPFSRKHDSNDE